jgi:pimeloyl-ACP methyl ester carboxylesterase
MKISTAALYFVSGLWHRAQAEPIPPPSGKYNVGMRRLVVDFVNPNDPTSPNNVSTGYMSTLYYPTNDEPSPPTPYLEPELAQIYADVWSFDVAHLTMTMRWNASFLCKPAGPTVFFGPGGWGPSTDGFRILLSDLASHGYTVAALDHPYEQPFLRFPNGTGVLGLPVDFQSTPEFREAFHAVRVREMLHFVDNWPQLVVDLNAPFDVTRLGAIGNSFGGSVALNVAIENDAIVAALNQDGTIFGHAASNQSSSDAGKPTMMLAFEGHKAEFDPSWNNYTSQQSDWWRVIGANGTMHPDWSDLTFWKIWGTTRPMGTIDGRRMVDIRSTYVRAFLDEHLLGLESPLLDTESANWPEVYVYEGSDI